MSKLARLVESRRVFRPHRSPGRSVEGIGVGAVDDHAHGGCGGHLRALSLIVGIEVQHRIRSHTASRDAVIVARVVRHKCPRLKPVQGRREGAGRLIRPYKVGREGRVVGAPTRTVVKAVLDGGVGSPAGEKVRTGNAPTTQNASGKTALRLKKGICSTKLRVQFRGKSIPERPCSPCTGYRKGLGQRRWCCPRRYPHWSRRRKYRWRYRSSCSR